MERHEAEELDPGTLGIRGIERRRLPIAGPSGAVRRRPGRRHVTHPYRKTAR
jgi:hypothetical protein